MKKKDARILFNVNDEGKITELEVIEFNQSLPSSKWPMRYYQKYNKDVGNCCSDWEEESLSTLLLKFLIDRDFADNDTKENFLYELCKIEEFEKTVKPWLKK